MKDKIILGVDEAGRGPILGPMTISGAMFRESDSNILKELGVKDSKMLSPKKREELFPKIKEIARASKTIEISPREIDQRYSVNINLNKLEAIKFAELINELKPDIAILDCPSSNPPEFERYMSKFLTHKCKIRCENYADESDVYVGAASILAKVTRDMRIAEIEKDVKMPVGVGYPHDPVTIKFVEYAFNNKEWLKKYVRQTWLTFQNIKNQKEQKKIGEF